MADSKPTLSTPVSQSTLRKQYPGEYSSWRNARTRCRHPYAKGFKYVGAKGLGMCERWESFANFLADMGPKPTPDHSIDRIDGNKGYEPENCRWATRSEQQHNTIRCRWLEHDGQRLLATDWANITGIRLATITYRIDVLDWDVEKALTTPARKGNFKGRPRHTLLYPESGLPTLDLALSQQNGENSHPSKVCPAFADVAPVAQLDRATVFGTK